MDWTFTIGSLSFGIFDIILLVLTLISGISGFAIGLSRFAFKIGSYVLTFPIALLFVEPVTGLLSSKLDVPVFLLALIAYVLLCVVIFLIFKLVGNLLGTALETVHLGWIDSLLGFIVAFVIALFLVFLLLEVCSVQKFIDLMPLKENSFFYMNVYLRLFPSVESAFKGALLGL